MDRSDRVKYVMNMYKDELKDENTSPIVYYINIISAAILCCVAYFAELKWVLVASSVLILCWLSEISQRLRIVLIHLGVMAPLLIQEELRHLAGTEEKD